MKYDILDEEITNMNDLYNFVQDTKETNNQSLLYIGTIHSVKGLEYDNVVLTGVDGRSFKLNNEENLNLNYVGVTRAKENLFILWGY